MKLSVALVVPFIASAACGHAATRPSIPRDADPATREAVYAEHELTYVDRLGSRSFRRADGTYSLRNVEGLATGYPESREAYESVKGRSLAISLLGGLGGGIIGFTAGLQLTRPEDESARISTRAALTLYGAGATLVILGVVLDRTWAREAAKEMAARYNQGRRRDLGLP